MSLSTSSLQCGSCQTVLGDRPRGFNRHGAPLCGSCYRKRVLSHHSKRQWSRWRSRLKRIAGYLLVALTLPPVIYFLVHLLAVRQAPPAI
jgi:hypothetical protein